MFLLFKMRIGNTILKRNLEIPENANISEYFLMQEDQKEANQEQTSSEIDITKIL